MPRSVLATIGGFPGASCGYVLPKRDALGIPGLPSRPRAAYRLRFPDAIATAIRAGAAALVTHDRPLRRVRGLRVMGPE